MDNLIISNGSTPQHTGGELRNQTRTAVAVEVIPVVAVGRVPGICRVIAIVNHWPAPVKQQCHHTPWRIVWGRRHRAW
jgi:hypothetical protein